MSMPEYDSWIEDPTPETLSGIVTALEPTMNAEVQRYTGPKPILRSRAKMLAIKAIRSYDPTRGAHLRSWVVTQLQPLSRYGQQLRQVHASETAIRQAAEVNRIREELSDELGRDPSVAELADKTGISVARINKVRQTVKPTVSESAFSPNADEVASLPGTVSVDRVGMAEEIIYDSLNPRDKMIYDLKTGKHGKAQLTNQEIAKRLGVTPALVSQRSGNIGMQINDIVQRGLV